MPIYTKASVLYDYLGNLVSVEQVGSKYGLGVVLLDSSGNILDITEYADGDARGSATGGLMMIDDGTNVQSFAGDSSGRAFFRVFNSDGTDNSLTTGGITAQKVHVVGESDKYIAGAVCQLDAGNTTSALLTAAAVYTGTWKSVMGLFSVIHVECIAAIPGYTSGTIEVQWSSDGINFDGSFDTATVGTTGGNPYSRSFRVKDNYYRVVFTNGAYDMTTAPNPKYFRISSTLHPVGGGSIVSGNGQFIVGGDGSGTPGSPITLGGDDGAGSLLNLQVDASGNLKITGTTTAITGNAVVTGEKMGTTGTATNVSVAASSTTLASSSTSRRGMIVHNDSSQVLYLKYGTSASATSYAYKIEPGVHWHMPMPLYSGTVTGIAGAATGTWRVTTW